MKAVSAAAAVVSGTLASTYPAVREAVPPARDLVDACAIGSDAAMSLASGVPLDGQRLAAGLAALDRDAAPNESATEIPILKPIRQLVAAAAKQAGRAGLTDEQWKALVVATAFPADSIQPKK